MAKNILVISCDIRETRAALIENGIIAELHIERKGRQSSTVGNVYLGKVTRVLPGLQAAFIDIGQERAAFLHVEDLIRPDDFDEYLAGGRKLARGEEGGGAEVDEEIAAEADGEIAAPPVESSETPAIVVSSVVGEDVVPSAPVIREVERREDLETTVAYPDWPMPPVKRVTPRIVGTAVQLSLSVDASADAAPTTAVSPSAEPVAEGAALVEEQMPLAPASADELIVRGHADSEPSLGSTPALDSDDDEDAEDEDDFDDETDDAASPIPPDVSSEVRLDHMQPDAPLAEASQTALADGEDDDEEEVEAGAEAEEDLLGDDLPGFTISEPGEPVPRAPSPARANERERSGERGGRRRRGRRRAGERPTEGRRGSSGGEARGGRSNGERGRGERGRGERSGEGRRNGPRPAQGLPGRISKSTPIREVVREGQEIIVQVTKDPIGTKGARCSSHISLPGRYVVYLPTVDHVGISKRIGNDKERARLREAIEAMKPPSGGLIVRTVAEGLTKKGLKQDVGYLVRLWGEIAKKRESAKAPNVLSSELDLVLKVARDLFTDEVDEVVIDDRAQYERLCRFVEMFAPERVKNVKYYDEEEPIFDEYGIEDEIGRALSRKVPLPSGGHLIIDQAEALTAIDVNTGRFVGKGSKDMEETILKTNLEAVHEIAYQLRFRNIGGLIILDLIDMEQHKNREKVRRTLEELLQKDKAKTTLNRISELGLIEMTRKRTRESLGRLMHEPCFYCDGTGQLQSKETIAYEILREIRRKRGGLPGYSVVVNAHPAVADVLNGQEKEAVADAENRFMRKITVVPRKEYHLEQFDLVGK